MSESEKQEIIDFASPPKVVTVLGIITILLSPIIYFIADAIEKDMLLSAAGAAGAALAGILFFSLGFWYGANVRKSLKKMQDSGSSKVFSDFRHGAKLLNGRIIIGERYLFCKGMGVALDCLDIEEIRVVTNGIKIIPISDNIIVRLNNRERLTLCSLDHSPDSMSRLREIVGEIAKRSPDAEIRL